ncbi:hypothetical protein SDC9_146223 [bioreactor metagenome]|uniref:Uncharacterized protein n=1 Tax=bioreactor metagenome TaxID=1076179 RepID=A0A645EE40_9ZZZZ
MDAVVVFGFGILVVTLAVRVSETEICRIIRHRIFTLYVHFYVVQAQTFTRVLCDSQPVD